MEKQSTFNFIRALFALVAVIGLSAPQVAFAEEKVPIVGWLRADDATLTGAVMVVELEGEICLHSVLLENGRFEFELPIGAKARLHFLKPGYLSKEVVVDTRNAMNTGQAERINKTVRFEVQLESEEARKNKVYLGPVGSIDFLNGTGLMKVRYDRRLVAAMAEEQ
ncbi:MAG: hypothetical protein IPK99_02980 [Flavobacteriales bacterium]|nr:hypothetical protein [Flavobacteriales bacterium]